MFVNTPALHPRYRPGRPLLRSFRRNQANSSTFNDLPPSSAQLPKSSVQHPNLPYNQGNQQFDGRRWYWLTVINYTGTIKHVARPCRASAFILYRWLQEMCWQPTRGVQNGCTSLSST